MPVYQRLKNFDEMFSKLTFRPVVVNDLLNASDEDRERARNYIFTAYTPDLLSPVPRCLCGEITEAHRMGVICEFCNTPVEPVMKGDMRPLLWFRAPGLGQPGGVDALINPIVWSMLSARLALGKFHTLRWITDHYYRPPEPKPELVAELKELGIERGYNNFVAHFYEYLDKLFAIRTLQKNSTKELEFFEALEGEEFDAGILGLIKSHPDCVFSSHIPLLNRALLVFERTSVGTYHEAAMPEAVGAIESVVGIDTGERTFTPEKLQSRTVRVIDRLASGVRPKRGYYFQLFGSKVQRKPGLLRKQKFGTRTTMNWRTIITSLTGRYKPDEMHIPWWVGLVTFRPYLINKLIRHGYRHNTAVGMLLCHHEQFHPLLYRLLCEIVEESRGGIPVLAQRPPTLHTGSIALLGATRFKSDVTDKTTSVPELLVGQWNADFDGDQMHFSVLTDRHMARLMAPLKPEANAFSLDSPGEFSNYFGIPKPTLITGDRWLADEDEPIDPDIWARFDALPEYHG